MSLYNMLFRTEPTAGIALKMLGIGPHNVPRFRDAFFTWADEAQTDPVIVIHTRTGGGNRACYESAKSYKDEMGEDGEGPFNADLRVLPGFRHDAGDDFDSTYADFYFDVPAAEKSAVVEFLTKQGKPDTPHDKFEKMLSSLKAS